jgi:hypothetical protein
MIEAILDLREWRETAASPSAIGRAWAAIQSSLVGQLPVAAEALEVRAEGGIARLWIVSTPSHEPIADDTPLLLLDVVRNPRLMYVCRDCGEYGPLRCQKCEDEEQPARLCSKCAKTILDELTAYCSRHLPLCECREGCPEKANFRCRKCRRLFGTHQQKAHPRDPETSYCANCHWVLFGRCQPCAELRKQRLGRSKCGFFRRDTGERCALPLCWEHSQQWRAWGQDNRGIPLCPEHVKALATVDLESILLSLLTTKPPISDRGRPMPLPNLFRVRKLLKTCRSRPESFRTILEAVQRLEPDIESRGRERLSRDYRYMRESYGEALADLAQKEPMFLEQIRDYYARELGSGYGSAILGAEVIERWKEKGQWRYRVDVRTSLTNRGHLIGPGGQRIKPLQEKYGIRIDFDGGQR